MGKRLDFQTKFEKTPYGVTELDEKAVISLAGHLGKRIDSLYSKGFTAIFEIIPETCDLPTALKNGSSNVSRTTENIVKLLMKSSK